MTVVNQQKVRCKFCDMDGLHWHPTTQGKFRLADDNNIFHNCPNWKTPSSAGETKPTKASSIPSLANEVQVWLVEWKFHIAEEARLELHDIIARHKAMR